MPHPLPALTPFEELTSILDDVVLASPADATEIVWLETRRQHGGHRLRSAPLQPFVESTAILRVHERGREGRHRTGGIDRGALQAGVRLALADARSRPKRRTLPPLPAAVDDARDPAPIADPALAELSAEEAERLLERACEGRGSASLEWIEAQVAIANSRELRRAARVTGATVRVVFGRGPAAAAASQSGRSLDQLDVAGAVARARRRRPAPGESGAVPETARLVLSPEAAIRLLELLNEEAFSARSYRDGSSFLTQHLGVQVFDRRLTVTDDATSTVGLAFPFDLEGRAKQPLTLIAAGVPKTPTLDLSSAAELGLAPTPHCLAGDEARASNLFLEAGELSDEELLACAENGVWVGGIGRVECYDPRRAQFRARLVEVRRIDAGVLGAPLPSLVWEDSLLRAFSSLLGLGRERVVHAYRDLVLGAACAPAVVVESGTGLRVAP